MLYGSECWALPRVDARKVDALDQWCLRRIFDIRWYHRVSNCEVWRLTEQPYYNHTEKKTHAVWASGQNGRVIRRQENSDCSSPEWMEKASWATLHLLDGHFDERPSSAQPYLDRDQHATAMPGHHHLFVKVCVLLQHLMMTKLVYSCILYSCLCWCIEL